MRSGGQTPTFELVGSYAYSEASYAIEMFEAYGRRYYDSQKYEMELFYARNADGSYAASSIGSTKPRQNGKSFGARDYALDLAVQGKRVLYSAHHGRTVRAMFKEMCVFIESHPDFLGELDYIYKAAGNEGIYFTDGGCIEFSTRTNSGGRGGTYDIVIIDEAQELTTAQQEALIPVVSAAQELEDGTGTQVIYLGTVPGPQCVGTVFKDMHDKAHSGSAGGMWWIEWGAQGQSISEIDLDDIDLWYACNPAMGRRISERAVRNERDTMSDDGFARERLGWWPPQSQVAVIKKHEWEKCRTLVPPSDGLYSYAVKFDPSGSVGTLSVCLKPADGKPHVEVIANRSMSGGITWFADWLEARKGNAAQITIDGMANAQPLVDELLRRGVTPKVICKPRSADMAAACAELLNAVNEGKLTHYDQQGLNDSALKSKKRLIGSGGGWGFADNDCDSTLIESCALAYWGALTTKRNPTRKQRVGF